MKRPLPIWPLGQMRFAIGLNVLRSHDAFNAWAPSFEAEIGLAITQQSLDSSRFGFHLRAQLNTCLSQSQKHQ